MKVLTEIAEKNAQREQETEHFVWEEVMEIHYGKNKKGKEEKVKRTRKNHAESSVTLKSICHHIVLTHQDRCSLNAILSETDTHATKQTNHYTNPASREK